MSRNLTRIGFFSTGLCTYWGQFAGLLDKLTNHASTIVSWIRETGGVVVCDAGMVDSPQEARNAAFKLKESAVDMVFIYVATYSLSSTILPVVKELGCPVILLNIQPGPSIDYKVINSLDDRGEKTGLWLEYCQACAIPEIAGVLSSAGLKRSIVTGHLSDGTTKAEVISWIEAAKVVRGMKDNRMGLLGHYYCGMLDVYTDLRKVSATFGTHLEIVEMDELATIRNQVSEEEVEAKLEEFRKKFDVNPNCSEYETRRAAKTAVALDKMVAAHDLGSMAYYYEGSAGNVSEDIVTSVIPGNTLLTGRGIPVAGEYEVKNALAMKIMSLLGAGGSFSEFYAMDFEDDVILLGHDGPAHPLIADGKVELVPLPVYHGKPGKGLSIQMTVRPGDVTLLSVCEGPDGVFLLTAEGESVTGDVLNIGNTNSRYRFPCGMRSFFDQWCEAGPSHHCAVGVGKQVEIIRRIAFLLGIGVKVVK
ncbi:MAG: L-fucose/L-arabinose isomerase family protein [Bacteroidales bacterium]|nr:L-fucose/L-arabinose isomerase family protein [Bacteroidales bacterium]